MLLAAYFDDSRNDNILTIGGYVTAVDHWDQSFAPEWAKFRDDPSWPSRITEFKTADCRGGYNEFEDWPRPELHRCMERAVGVIRNSFPPSDLVGISVGIEMPPEWKGTRMEEHFLGFAYLTSFGLIIRDVLHIRTVAGVEPKGEVQFIFDKQTKLEGVAREMFKEAIALGGVEAEGIPDPEFRHGIKVLPLQAADLFAYETFKEIKKRREDPGRKVSGALTALLDAHYHVGFCVDANTTRDLVARHLLGDKSARPASKLMIFESGKPIRGDS